MVLQLIGLDQIILVLLLPILFYSGAVLAALLIYPWFLEGMNRLR